MKNIEEIIQINLDNFRYNEDTILSSYYLAELKYNTYIAEAKEEGFNDEEKNKQLEIAQNMLNKEYI